MIRMVLEIILKNIVGNDTRKEIHYQNRIFIKNLMKNKINKNKFEFTKGYKGKCAIILNLTTRIIK